MLMQLLSQPPTTRRSTSAQRCSMSAATRMEMSCLRPRCATRARLLRPSRRTIKGPANYYAKSSKRQLRTWVGALRCAPSWRCDGRNCYAGPERFFFSEQKISK
ncbi:unnamed protein product [Amoebophrya sp. A120]|nr:unnamed protein product [Amoebophrya sp. A120]|eukprot:GSA120T00013953001.1